MTKADLIDLLRSMRDASIYSDNHISPDVYEVYMKMINNATEEELPECIRNIVYQLDIQRPEVARKIAYPFYFNEEVFEWRDSQIQDGKYYCVACQVLHPCMGTDSESLTIDHEPALSVRFNDGEYELSREERKLSYNDTTRMQLMCRSQNSRKGGVPYNKGCLEQVFNREL